MGRRLDQGGTRTESLSISLGARSGDRLDGFRGVLMAELIPNFNESLRLGITPGEAFFFQRVGTPAPLLAPFDWPIGNDAAIGERVKDRRRRDLLRSGFGVRSVFRRALNRDFAGFFLVVIEH
jgi:hypothetical protein